MFLEKTDKSQPSETTDDGRLRLMEEKYSADCSTPLPGEFNKLINKIGKETKDNFSTSFMMVSRSQGQFLHQIVKMLRPSNILEIGSFTGASAVAMGSALGSQGKLLSFEIDLEALQIAKNNVESSSLKDKVTFKHGPAMDSLIKLAEKTPRPQFDLIFIDADKPGYINYYNFILEKNLLSDNGVILVDNVLFYGQVHRKAGYEELSNFQSTPYIMQSVDDFVVFNKHVQQDPRTEVVLLPIYDGVSLIRKKN